MSRHLLPACPDVLKRMIDHAPVGLRNGAANDPPDAYARLIGRGLLHHPADGNPQIVPVGVQNREVFPAVISPACTEMREIHNIPAQRGFLSAQRGRCGVVCTRPVPADGRFTRARFARHHRERACRVRDFTGSLHRVQLSVQFKDIVPEIVCLFSDRGRQVQGIPVFQIIPGHPSDQLLTQPSGAYQAHSVACSAGDQLELYFRRHEPGDFFVRVQAQRVLPFCKQRVRVRQGVPDRIHLDMKDGITATQSILQGIAFEHVFLNLPGIQKTEDFLVH